MDQKKPCDAEKLEWLRQELDGDAVLPDFAAKFVELFGESNISTVIQQKSVCLRLYAKYSGARVRKESDLAPEDLEGFQQVWDKDAPKRCYECNKATPPGARENRCSPECRGAGKKLACRVCKSTNVSYINEARVCGDCGKGAALANSPSFMWTKEGLTADCMLMGSFRRKAHNIFSFHVERNPGHEPAWKRRKRS